MTPYNRGIACFTVLLLCACAPNIKVDYDKNADFSRYRTYNWGTGVPAKRPEVDRQIVNAIDEQMARKGFTKTEGDADLTVVYHAATHEEVDYHETSYTSGAGPGYGSPISASAGDVPMRVKVGTVMVDMYDTKEKRNVWRGVGSDLVMDDPAKTSAEIQKGAAKLFEKFPPKQ